MSVCLSRPLLLRQYTRQHTAPRGARRHANDHIIKYIGGAASRQDSRGNKQASIPRHTVHDGAPGSLVRLLALCGSVCCPVSWHSLSSNGAAYIFNDMVIGVPSCTRCRDMLSCVGAAVLSSSGAAYIFNDMVTGVPSCTGWRGMLSCALAQQSCLVAAPPTFLMIWSLARVLALCGAVSCLVCWRGSLV